MNPLTSPWVWCQLGIALACCLGLWFWRGRQRNAGWVDVAWSGLLAFHALSYSLEWLLYAPPPRNPVAALLAGALASLWGLRLAWYLGRRVAAESEDGRYRALREYLGSRAATFFLLFFLAQAGLAWAMGIIFHQVIWQLGMAPTPGLFYPALALGLLAIWGERLADRQLARHRQQHPGVTCRSGLWRYSRHPNYFFEWLHWWSYPLMLWSLPQAWQTWGFWWVNLAPWMMLLFLYRVSGIPFNERQAVKSRGDDYRRYQQETSPFIPWWPRLAKTASPQD